MKRSVVIAIILAALLAGGGCLFEPREAELPLDDDEGDWVVPKTPKDVFLNLATGLASPGNSNYERSLADVFTFTPRDQDRLNFPDGTFDNWTKSVELDVLTRIKGDYQGERTAQFGDENGQFEREDVQVGWAEYEGQYRWTLDPGDGSEPEIYAGTAVFYLEEGTSGWVIVRWEDIDVIGSYPTSGNLRGTFRAAN